jgi:murein DD-endopeptidase MepM/ murein hydrolase activator NlpD
MRFGLNLLRFNHRYGWLLLALWLLGDPSGHVAEASPTQQTDQPPETVTYVVQPGDTLYGIAQQFGITVDILVAANNIDDPTQIVIGQKLTIPPPPKTPEPQLVHTVQAGETLHELGLRYGPSVLEIAQENQLVRADRLYLGQSLVIMGETSEAPLLRGRTHTVEEGEILAQVAAEYQVTPWSLVIANRLNSPYAIPAVTHLWIPGDNGEFFDWDEPFSGVLFHPNPAAQGQTLSIQISTTITASLFGNWMEDIVVFHPYQEHHAALIGIAAMADAGVYTLVITSTTVEEQVSTFSQRLLVIDGEYGNEEIVVADDIAASMTSDVVLEENSLLDQLFSAQTESPYWEGYMGLPTTGEISSVFGTRRTYNIPDASPYHTGTDFWNSIGTPVYSPADGVVVFSEPLVVRGNVIIIDHGWGVMTGYWHLSTSHVSVGDTVSQGQHIGNIGNTGLSTGPHLHWEMRVGGQPVNGLQWVREQFP